MVSQKIAVVNTIHFQISVLFCFVVFSGLLVSYANNIHLSDANHANIPRAPNGIPVEALTDNGNGFVSSVHANLHPIVKGGRWIHSVFSTHEKASPSLLRLEHSLAKWLVDENKSPYHRYRHALVQLSDEAMRSSKLRRRIEKEYGIQFSKLYSRNAYDIVATEATIAALAMPQSLHVKWIGLPFAHHKVSSMLEQQMQKTQQVLSSSEAKPKTDVVGITLALTKMIHPSDTCADDVLALWLSSEPVSSNMIADMRRSSVAWLESSEAIRKAGGSIEQGDANGCADILDSPGFQLAVESGVDSSSTIWANVHSENLAGLVRWLACQPNVLYIQKTPQFDLKNVFASAVAQSGNTNQEVNENTAPLWMNGITGEGQFVHITDTGVDWDSCMFRDTLTSAVTVSSPARCYDDKRKIECYFATADFFDAELHGTHVSGTAVGLHASLMNATDREIVNSGLANGQAPRARLIFTDIGLPNGRLVVPSNLQEGFLSDGYNSGARISSHSWGCFSETNPLECNIYDLTGRSADAFSWNNLDALVLFAAGNAGDSVLGNDGRSTIGSPATAKNSVAVGAAQTSRPDVCRGGDICSPNNLALFSSRGPTLDGRIKPDLIFPGENIYSAASSGRVLDFEPDSSCASESTASELPLSGTSMATPAVAGLAALVRQYVQNYDITTGKQRSETFQPSGAMLKSLLILASQIPNGRFRSRTNLGFVSTSSRIRADRAPRQLVGNGLLSLKDIIVPLSDEIEHPVSGFRVFTYDRYSFSDDGEMLEFRFRSIPGVRSQAKIVLVYTDVPGTLTETFDDTDPVLVNDLDLIARCEGSGCQSVLLSEARSRRNNVEVIGVAKELSPIDLYSESASENEPLTLIIQVEAIKIVLGDQQFSLAILGSGLEPESIPDENWVPTWSRRANTNSVDTPTESGGGLSIGVIVGIAVGAVSLVLLLGVLGYIIFVRGVYSEDQASTNDADYL